MLLYPRTTLPDFITKASLELMLWASVLDLKGAHACQSLSGMNELTVQEPSQAARGDLLLGGHCDVSNGIPASLAVLGGGRGCRRSRRETEMEVRV